MCAPNTPVSTGTPSVAQRLHVGLVHGLALLRRGRVGEARAVAAPDVGVERELRDGEHPAADVSERQVHEPRVVREHAQPGRLGGELAGRGHVVLVGDSHEGEEAAADRAPLGAVHGDRGAAHPLQQHSHALAPSLMPPS